jgi:hypothetical protein
MVVAISTLFIWYSPASVCGATIDEIRSTWREHSGKVRTLRYVGQVHQTGKNIELINKEFRRGGNEQRNSFVFTISGDKAAMDLTTYVLDPVSNEESEQLYRVAFDGTETRELFPVTTSAHATIFDMKDPAAQIGNRAELDAIWMAHFPLRSLEAKTYYILDQLSVGNNRTYFDGKLCVELTVPSKQPKDNWSASLLVDPANQYRVVCMRELIAGEVRRETVLSYSDNSEIQYDLNGWTIMLFEKGRSPVAHIVGTIKESQVNQTVDPSIFSLTFPEGTQVNRVKSANIREKGEVLIQTDARGTLRPMTKSDLVKITQEDWSSLQYILFILTALVFFIALATAVRKHLRRTN